MSIAATYVSSTSFTVSDDRTGDFVPGRALRMDCGTDGVKYGYVSYSSYSSPNTTINLDSTESQAVTSNLASVLFSRTSYKETGGNIPIQTVWMQRGFKNGMILSYKDADEIYIDSGALHIDNGTAENIYCAQSQLTKQLTSLTTSTWYAVYVDPPDSGLTLSAADIEYSSTMPSYSHSKCGWYHPTNTDWRCIGFVYASGSASIYMFHMDPAHYILEQNIIDVSGSIPGATWTTATLSVPLGGITARTLVLGVHVDADIVLYVRMKGSSASNMLRLTATALNKYPSVTADIPVDSARQMEYRWNYAYNNTVYIFTYGFVLPSGI